MLKSPGSGRCKDGKLDRHLSNAQDLPRFRRPRGKEPTRATRNAYDVRLALAPEALRAAGLAANPGVLQFAQGDVHLTQEIIIGLSDSALGDHALQAELLFADASLRVSNLLVDGEQGPGLRHRNLLCTPSRQRQRWPVCSLTLSRSAFLLGNFQRRLCV